MKGHVHLNIGPQGIHFQCGNLRHNLVSLGTSEQVARPKNSALYPFAHLGSFVIFVVVLATMQHKAELRRELAITKELQ